MTVIAEALNERRRIFTEINELDERIAAAAVRDADEPEEPADQPVDALLAQLDADLERLRELSVALNQVNNRTMVAFEGRPMTLMEAIALRDQLALDIKQRKAILSAIESALGKATRHGLGFTARRTKDDIRQETTLPLRDLRDQIGVRAMRLRLLDLEIQKVNWSAPIDI